MPIAKKLKETFTTATAVSTNDPVAINANGTVSKINSTATPAVSYLNYIGLAESSVSSGSTVSVVIHGPITGLSSLTSGSDLFVNQFGQISHTNSTTSMKIGTATSATAGFLFTTSNLDIYLLNYQKIDTEDLSVSTGSASGTGSLSYNNSTGVFTFAPADLSTYATQSYVGTQISNLVDSAPSTLDTLNELAAALGDDANFSTTITNSLATKAPLASPALTGVPTAPTASSSTNTTQIATTAFVQSVAGSGIALTDLSVTSASASGGGALSYNNSSGVFTYTPPNLSNFLTTVSFASLTGKPTTIAGYGITDVTWANLGSKPTTIAGFGITDAFDGVFSSLTGRPNSVSGYGITDALTTGADADIGSNDFITTGKVYFANMFATTAALPSATTYHGMFAHVHANGAAYFAHGGNWIQLANNSDLTAKANLASPALTGVPTAPTAASGTNTTQIATTAFVTTAVGAASGTYNDASVDTHLNRSSASTNQVLSWNGSDYAWVAQSGGGGGGASVTTSDAAPSSPSDGDLWYNTSVGGLFVYYQDANSSQWVEVVGKTGATGPTGGASVSVSDAAPSSPSAGQLWWNSSVNKLYIYYTDANSSQWVQATTPGAAGADGGSITRYANVAGFPGSPTAADLAYANDTNTLYLYNGTAWEVVASGNDESPVILTEPPTSTQSLTGGATSTVTMVAQDPEGFDITYGIAYKTTGNARPSQLGADTTINQSTGVYTFTASNNSSHAGSFRARLSASDGARTTTRFVDFDLAFHDFTISPAVSGQSTWTLASGALTLDTAQVYTITPVSNMNINAKMWGAGGSSNSGNTYSGGAGGYASGTIALTGGTSYKIRVGSPTGGGAGGSGAGGGYSGIFVTSETHGNSVMIAGGGGGGANRYSVDQSPAAGGGASGQTGGYTPSPAGGGGGTQSAGGAGSAAGTSRGGTAGSALTGGVGHSAGSYGGGGGGSGYYGGGGGASRVGGDGGNNGCGGGGSGYIGHSTVSNGVNTAGNTTTPGNSSDSARGTAGNPAVAGKVVISASS